MTNQQVLEKMSKDMQMRNFSKYTYYAYMHKGKEIIKYFNKPMEEVTTEELRNFLFNYLTEKRKLADRPIAIGVCLKKERCTLYGNRKRD